MKPNPFQLRFPTASTPAAAPARGRPPTARPPGARPAGVNAVRCAADGSGAWNGEYEVTGLKAPHFIYRDPESGRWYEARTEKHFADCWLGDTKKAAVDRLTERDGGR